jgi:hypothetical protein
MMWLPLAVAAPPTLAAVIWTPAVIAPYAACAVALISSVVSAVSSWRSNRNARLHVKLQLDHDTEQRNRDRLMTMRRDVYIPGVEAIVACQGLLGQFSNPDTDQIAVQRQLQTDLATIAKIQVIGSEKTIGAVMAYLSMLVPAFMALAASHARLLGPKRQIKELTILRDKAQADVDGLNELMKQQTLSGNSDAERSQRIRDQIACAEGVCQVYANTIKKLSREQFEAQIQVLEAIPSITKGLSERIVDAVIAARRDIELPTDEATLRRLYVEQHALAAQKMIESAETYRRMLETDM